MQSAVRNYAEYRAGADHDLLGRKAHLLPVAQQDLDSPQEFAPEISVARPCERSQKLMGMGLQYHRPGAHHFSAFAALVAFGAHLVEATVRSRQ